MPPIYCISLQRLLRAALGCVAALSMVAIASAQMAPPAFVGAASCSSSLCHGGAGDKSRQYTIWTKQDAHARADATLTTARAARLADVLKLGDPTKSSSCTTCHSPLAGLALQPTAGAVQSTEAVSCESCHGAAAGWLRAHTRTDYSHADRVHAGMRDLNNLYVRANGCVACHETLEPALFTAGHPELIFELDGQAVSQPRHWHEKGDFQGPQAWLVGQAVALRELSWQLSQAPGVDDRLAGRWQGLLWMLHKLDGLPNQPVTFPVQFPALARTPFKEIHGVADRLAKSASEMEWTEKETLHCLATLARTAPDFRNPTVSKIIQARRGERLALAIDRLTAALDKPTAARLDPPVRDLFRLAQSLPDFNPTAFAQALDSLAKKL